MSTRRRPIATPLFLFVHSGLFVAMRAFAQAPMHPEPSTPASASAGSSVVAIDARYPWDTTGALQWLDQGAMIGWRPVVRGLVPPGNYTGHEMDMAGMQGGSAPADARDPDYSDGHAHGPMVGMDMADDAPIGMLLIDRLEYFDARSGEGGAIDTQAWYGVDRDKLWLKAEGDYSEGTWLNLRTEVLWNLAVSAYWNMQVGIRNDSGLGPDRQWLAFGFEGLAPYWFDVDATAYLGPSGRSSFRLDVEYELLLTQRVFLQPSFETNLYGQDDVARGIGSGLSDAQLGLRLRYELRREFAPYIGIVIERKFGRTADIARSDGEPVYDPQVVVGLHMWF